VAVLLVWLSHKLSFQNEIENCRKKCLQFCLAWLLNCILEMN